MIALSALKFPTIYLFAIEVLLIVAIVVFLILTFSKKTIHAHRGFFGISTLAFIVLAILIGLLLW